MGCGGSFEEVDNDDGQPLGSHAAEWRRVFGDATLSGARCEAYVRAAHRSYVERHGIDVADFPLLRLELDDWERPFRVDGAS